MDEKEFKHVFGQLAEGLHFEKAFGGFLKKVTNVLLCLNCKNLSMENIIILT